MTTGYSPSQSLQDTLGFTAGDLAANRAGQLTPGQVAALRADARPFWRLLIILGVFALLVGGALLFFAGGSPDAPMLLLLTLMVPGGLGLIFAVRLAGIYASIGDGRVLAAEGLAHTYAKRTLRGGAAYYVRIDAEEFFVSRPLQQAFEPGRAYRVFYTPRGRLVVSGEFAPAPSADTQASRLLAPELAHALSFSRQDLDANRAGRLSSAQVAHLRAARRRALATAFGGGIGTAFVVLLWPLLNTSTTAILFWGLILLFPAALLVASLWRVERHSRDLRAGSVAQAGGVLRRHTEGVGSTHRQPAYFLSVGGVRLGVPLDVYGAFADEGHYALYFAPYSRALLAAEPLDAPLSQVARMH